MFSECFPFITLFKKISLSLICDQGCFRSGFLSQVSLRNHQVRRLRMLTSSQSNNVSLLFIIFLVDFSPPIHPRCRLPPGWIGGVRLPIMEDLLRKEITPKAFLFTNEIKSDFLKRSYERKTLQKHPWSQMR